MGGEFHKEVQWWWKHISSVGLIHGVVHGLSIIAVFSHCKLSDSIGMCIIFNAYRAGLKMDQHLWLCALGMLIDIGHQKMLMYSPLLFVYKFNISLY